MEDILENIDVINELCNRHKVRRLYLFGSILSDTFNQSSDIDMLIEFEDIELLQYFDNYMDFKESLENLLQREIDLVENQAVRNPVFRKILDREKKLIYERKVA
jgi:hypothetical protein